MPLLHSPCGFRLWWATWGDSITVYCFQMFYDDLRGEDRQPWLITYINTTSFYCVNLEVATGVTLYICADISCGIAMVETRDLPFEAACDLTLTPTTRFRSTKIIHRWTIVLCFSLACCGSFWNCLHEWPPPIAVSAARQLL